MNAIRPFSFKAQVFRFAVAAMSAVAAMECFGAGAEPQEVQVAPRTLPPLPSLQWRLPAKYATLDGDRLVIDIPAGAYPADAVAEADLPAGLFAGAEGFSLSISARGSALAKPTKSYLGFKFQMHLKENATGRESWPNCGGRLGDFADAELRNDASFGGMRPDAVTLMFGLQGTSGRVEFDLSTLRGAPSPGLFRRINQDYIVRYPDKPDTDNRGTSDTRQATSGDAARRNVEMSPGESLVACRLSPASQQSAAPRPLRGCMLPARPTTENDIETLASWGATMARYQIVRNWNGRDDNQDLDEYAAWIDSRLDNIEDVLRWARARGMKIVIDLHTPPGGKRASDGEMNMLHDDVFAEAFIDTWRRIAARCAAAQAACAPALQSADPVIYGYDLINEPHQHGRAKNDYWTLQRRAAEVVRAIDPATPIIVESNGSDAPPAYEYLSPLRMDNVIYQVHCYAPMPFTHQGVHGAPVGPRWPDPEKKWDADFLREVLRPVREFEKRHHAKIYVGEFSAIAWAEGAGNYLRDCISVFEEYGWDWTYHAFREWKGWSVEHEGPDDKHMIPSSDNPRKRALLEGFTHP